MITRMRFGLAFLLLLLAALPASADMFQNGANAKLPEARNNLLNTPPRCDGFTAGDGEITSGTNVFTSASASFGSANVGWDLTVAGAGPNQHADVPTIVSGGAGYAVDDLLTAVGGTGTATVLRVKKIDPGGIVTEVGYTALGIYSVVPAGTISTTTTGSGIGFTFTSTWLRDALVATISAVDGPNQVQLSANASATVSAATWGMDHEDHAPALNAEDIVRLPADVCGIKSPVVLTNGKALLGSALGKTVLIWLGPARGGPMLTTDDPVLKVSRDRISDLRIDGLGSADVCLKLQIEDTWFNNIVAQRCVSIIADMDGSPNAPYTANNATGFLNNTIANLTLDSGSASTASAMPMRWGALYGNVGYTRALNIKILYKDQTGWECGYADNNTGLVGMYFFRHPGGVARAADFRGDTHAQPSGTASCQFNTIYGLTLTPLNETTATIVSRGGLTVPARENSIYSLNLANGVGAPVIESGSRLNCHRSNGNDNFCTARAYNYFECGTPAGTAVGANFVAMGCGSGAQFIPNTSRRVRLYAAGDVSNDTAGNGAFTSIWYGTGTPPANGDNVELVGTPCGSGTPALTDTPSGTFTAPFALNCLVSNLDQGGTYWFDVAIKRKGNGTAVLGSVRLSADELP